MIVMRESYNDLCVFNFGKRSYIIMKNSIRIMYFERVNGNYEMPIVNFSLYDNVGKSLTVVNQHFFMNQLVNRLNVALKKGIFSNNDELVSFLNDLKSKIENDDYLKKLFKGSLMKEIEENDFENNKREILKYMDSFKFDTFINYNNVSIFNGSLEKEPDEEVSNQIETEEVSNQIENEKVSNQIENEEVSNEVVSNDMSDQVVDEIVDSEEVTNKVVSEPILFNSTQVVQSTPQVIKENNNEVFKSNDFSFDVINNDESQAISSSDYFNFGASLNENISQVSIDNSSQGVINSSVNMVNPQNVVNANIVPNQNNMSYINEVKERMSNTEISNNDVSEFQPSEVNLNDNVVSDVSELPELESFSSDEATVNSNGAGIKSTVFFIFFAAFLVGVSFVLYNRVF